MCQDRAEMLLFNKESQVFEEGCHATQCVCQCEGTGRRLNVEAAAKTSRSQPRRLGSKAVGRAEGTAKGR